MQSRELTKKLEASVYLTTTTKIIKNELEWVDLYFDNNKTKQTLLTQLEQVLFADHYQLLLEKSFHWMVSTG